MIIFTFGIPWSKFSFEKSDETYSIRTARFGTIKISYQTLNKNCKNHQKVVK